MADAAFEQEDLRTAAAMYGRAWASAERQPSVPYRLAQIALEEKRTEDAVHWLRELFALPDGDGEWSRRVAGLFARADQPALGIAFFRRRLAASRQPDETRRALSRLHALQGSVAFQAGKVESAMRELHDIDQVAYVRFASVYRSFKDINEFMEELEELLKERKGLPSTRSGPRKPEKEQENRLP